MHPPCDYAKLREEANRLIEMGLKIAPIIPIELDIFDNKGRRIYTGKNPSYWQEGGKPTIVYHSHVPKADMVLAAIDTAEKLDMPIGLAILPGDDCTIIDFDPKDYEGGVNECQADVNRLLTENPKLKNTRIDKTPSGGSHLYLRVADLKGFMKDDGKTRGQFTTTQGGTLRGELLSGTRVSVTSPTQIKTSDRDGAYTLTGNPYNIVSIESLESVGIFPVQQKPKRVVKAKARHQSRQVEHGEKSPPTLNSLIRSKAQELLKGQYPYGSDRSTNLTGFAREVYGCENYLLSSKLPYRGSVDALINLAIEILDIGDKADRVLDSIDRDACTWYEGEEDTALEHYANVCKCASAHQQPSRSETKERTYTELIKLMLAATVNGDEDELMELRSECITRFRRTDAQVETALFKLHTRQQLGITTKDEPESLDLSRISGMDWLLEGFIPDKDLTLIWGDAGSGKTTAALATALAVLKGTGLLDHTKPAERKSVLFIASDSGAVPLYAAMQDMGMADLPDIKQGPDQRLFVWASDPDQGMTAWAADLSGCIRLLEFVKRNGIGLVLIDSCKAVCSGANLDYTNNQLVTSMMTYFKEVICPHTAVVWLNHDGVAKGAHAGAKAWKEIPSMVHQIKREEHKDGSKINSRRIWLVNKSRMGPTRDFYYHLDEGCLKVCPNQELVGNCFDRVLSVLSSAFNLEGKDSLSKKELVERICADGLPTRKTLENTLSSATRGRHPQIQRCGRGRYKLAPRVIDALIGED